MVQADPDAADGLVILTTSVPDEATAARLSVAALDRRLAACVQSSAIASRYVWEGQREEAAELRLDFKTTVGAAEALATMIAEAHPYDEPEVVVTAVLSASEGYAEWVRRTCRQKEVTDPSA